MKTSQKGFSVPLIATTIASVTIVVVCLIYAFNTPSNKPDANGSLKKEAPVLLGEVLGAPKCKKQYTTKGASNEEKYFSKMDCIPQLDQINYWESEDYFKKFDSIPVKVAVIDGYFNTNHPDLKNAITKTYSLAKASCYPVDFSKSDCLGVLPPNVPVTSENITGLNHGSIIAGVTAGQGVKGQGMVGINPSAQLILISKNSKPDDVDSYIRALQGAIDLKPDVISMSFPLGVPPGDSASVDLKTRFEELLKQAVSKGIVVTLAAGNYSLDVNTKEIYPTRLSTIDGVISVGARDYESLAKYSNYGTNFVGISAPGLVRSTAGKTQDNSPYMLSAGTSFAGPLVAGAASRVIQILKSNNISYTPADIENILYAGSDSHTDLKDKFTNGLTLNLMTLANLVSSLTQKDIPFISSPATTPQSTLIEVPVRIHLLQSSHSQVQATVIPDEVRAMFDGPDGVNKHYWNQYGINLKIESIVKDSAINDSGFAQAIAAGSKPSIQQFAQLTPAQNELFSLDVVVIHDLGGGGGLTLPKKGVMLVAENIGKGSNSKNMTFGFAHEFGHILLGGAHFSNSIDPYNIMAVGDPTAYIPFDKTHLTQDQITIAQAQAKKGTPNLTRAGE